MTLLESEPLLVFPPELYAIPLQQIIKMTFLISLQGARYETDRDVIHTHATVTDSNSGKSGDRWNESAPFSDEEPGASGPSVIWLFVTATAKYSDEGTVFWGVTPYSAVDP
jgi:hypothetical protein